MTAFWALVRKDLLLYGRNRRALLMSLMAPILIGAFFGSLFNQREQKAQQVPVALVDADRSALSARLLAALQAEPGLKLRALDADAAAAQVRRGELRVAVTLPPGFGQQAVAAMRGQGPRPELTLLYDPSQAVVLALVRGLLTQHVAQTVAAAAFGPPAPGSPPGLAAGGGPGLVLPFTLREAEAVDARSQPGAGYDSYAHSFAGMGVQFILLMAVDIGITLLLVRRSGLWLRLRAAPLSRAQLLGSRLVSAAVIGLGVFVVVFGVAIAAFGVRVQGSWVGLLAVMAANGLASAAFGLMIAAVGRSPEATRGLAILATLLLVMLGGAWVPSFLFPPWLQAVAAWTPTHWAVQGLDAMTWRALPLADAVAPVAALLGFALLFGGVALWRFRWDE